MKFKGFMIDTLGDLVRKDALYPVTRASLPRVNRVVWPRKCFAATHFYFAWFIESIQAIRSLWSFLFFVNLENHNGILSFVFTSLLCGLNDYDYHK